MNSKYLQQVEELNKNGSFRSFRPLDQREGCYVQYQEKTLLNLTSNDYLGIAGDRDIHHEFYRGLMEEQYPLDKYGLGAASSRLLTGDSHISHKLEEALCREYQRESCLLFNSGYHANIGILPTLTDKRDLILSDKLNHASIHDGMRLSRAACKRFRHCDYDHLTALLEQHRENFDQVVIVTESVFSMDGDVADLKRLIEIKNRFDCLLYVDEAHGVGVYGPKGLGKAEECNAIADIDLLVGTFGKAYSSVGAFVLCHKSIYEYLINFSRSLIFTTALPPVVTHWNLFIFQKVIGMHRRRKDLAELADKMRALLNENNLPTAGSTNIVPVIIGDNKRAVDLAEMMQELGYLIFAVRPPTVPEGTARFRLSLTANMLWHELENLPKNIRNGISGNDA